MFILFLVLIVGPIIIGKHVPSFTGQLPSGLAQPTGLNNNDTNYSQTGTGALGATDGVASATAGARRVVLRY